jgi:hypothetical protein
LGKYIRIFVILNILKQVLSVYFWKNSIICSIQKNTCVAQSAWSINLEKISIGSAENAWIFPFYNIKTILSGVIICVIIRKVICTSGLVCLYSVPSITPYCWYSGYARWCFFREMLSFRKLTYLLFLSLLNFLSKRWNLWWFFQLVENTIL